MAAIDLSISPAQVEFVAKPGAIITQAYEVTNNSPSTVYLTPSVESWLPFGSNGQVTYNNVLSNPSLNYSLLNSDLKLNQTFSLGPNSSTQLVLVIKSASNTPLGDSYSTLFLTQDSDPALTSDSPSTAARIGSHILLSISSVETPESTSTISNVTITPFFKDILLTPINFSATINNQSDYFFATKGEIVLSKNDLIINKLTLFPHNVLANHSRTLACQKEDQPTPCHLNPPFWPGKYVLSINLDSHPNGPVFTSSFFVLPYSFILVLSIGLLFYLAIRRFRSRHPTD